MSRWKKRPDRRRGTVSVSPAFFLLLILFAAVDRQRLLFHILLAAAVHECGHVIVLRLLGGHIAHFRITLFGAELRIRHSERLSYGREIAAVLAGPGGNLLCGLLLPLLLPEPVGTEAAGANWVLGLFNLLPAAPMDGWRAIQLLLCWWLGPDRGTWWSALIRTAGTLALLGQLVWLMAASGGNVWLLPPAIGMAVNSVRGCLSLRKGRKQKFFRGKRLAMM